MREVYLVSAVRSAIGTFGGAFKEMMPSELVVPVLQEAVARAGIHAEQVEEVILGNCIQRTDEPNVARTGALKAGFPITATGYTIQRQCASGLQAILSGMQQIQTGNADVIVAGGVEVMSSSPYVLKQYRWGGRLQHGQVTDTVWEILEDPIHKIMMGETAERVAEKYGITREEQDQVAFESHRKALAAQESGRFDREIVKVAARAGRKTVEVSKDEHPRPDISFESLSALKPVFRKDGTVTAGNASGINDGAAAVVLMSGEKVKELGVKPMARLVAGAVAGVEPELMGYGPVPAVQKLLAKTGMKKEDIDVWEINEAFAAQYLAVEKLLELDRSKVNLNGSGISLGHPVGCTGARITTTLVHELHQGNFRYGISSLCVGGGIGVALLLERV
ncbi:thiolase family protein [Effusibacillus lacus]|uniref:acetyl-CoA C-acetyltransferase n=1 Tax=Effusibacillus lacus TaxID=1348429 RepID=A0A292YKK5_9BACL|nr:thiolase family protein [Effusibacillus lacus]TCS73658.1 acetyl-CoA acetyltransferase [Effusibacillus lacus]GAX89451.1 acetyl-CoA acetyltransferase [Effusibacillus lacus]